VNGDDRTLDQVRKQLEKIVTVVHVSDFAKQNIVERDLMLIKVSTAGNKRSEVKELVDIFRARIVDVGTDHVVIEISGQERKIEAFIDGMRPFGIIATTSCDRPGSNGHGASSPPSTPTRSMCTSPCRPGRWRPTCSSCLAPGQRWAAR